MKPANLRKRGGKSRSVHTLADKVEYKKTPYAPAVPQARFFIFKNRVCSDPVVNTT